MSETEAKPLQPGTLVRDKVTGRVGRFMAVESLIDMIGKAPARPMAFLRPVGGGPEWMTPPDQIVPAEEDDR